MLIKTLCDSIKIKDSVREWLITRGAAYFITIKVGGRDTRMFNRSNPIYITAGGVVTSASLAIRERIEFALLDI
jgi:hypothetical protein